MTVIDEPFVAVDSNGQRRSFQLVIHSPVAAREKSPWWWSCSVSLKPLYGRAITCGGVTPFHALAAAVARATDLLSRFMSTGGKILKPSGEEVGLPSSFQSTERRTRDAE